MSDKIARFCLVFDAISLAIFSGWERLSKWLTFRRGVAYLCIVLFVSTQKIPQLRQIPLSKLIRAVGVQVIAHSYHARCTFLHVSTLYIQYPSIQLAPCKLLYLLHVASSYFFFAQCTVIVCCSILVIFEAWNSRPISPCTQRVVAIWVIVISMNVRKSDTRFGKWVLRWYVYTRKSVIFREMTSWGYFSCKLGR